MKPDFHVEEDEGIIPCTAEILAGLRTVAPDSILTVGAQTHAADGNTGMIVTSKEKAEEISADKSVAIRVLPYRLALANKAYMPEAPIPSARRALENERRKAPNVITSESNPQDQARA